MAREDLAGTTEELDRLADRLHPEQNRREVLGRLDEVFRSGGVPDPWPAGFAGGRLLAAATWGPWDSVVQRIAGLWMPWLGKSFDGATNTGINRFRQTAGTRWWMRVLFPSHTPALIAGDLMEAFPFRNAAGPGEVDQDVQVLKIDYDFEANPALIRRVLDELVEVGPGVYLGKILFRLGGRYRADSVPQRYQSIQFLPARFARGEVLDH